MNKNLIIAFVLLIITGATYRLIGNRPLGFAPQLAMALFAGAVIKDKKWAFAIPLFSMLISDGIFEILNRNGLVNNMPGFYEGQWLNYLLIMGTTVFGFGIRNMNVAKIGVAAIASPVAYFLLSNFFVWLGHGGYQHPMTFSGLMNCYADGLIFLRGSVMATVSFSAVLFGIYYFVANRKTAVSNSIA